MTRWILRALELGPGNFSADGSMSVQDCIDEYQQVGGEQSFVDVICKNMSVDGAREQANILKQCKCCNRHQTSREAF